VLAYGLGPKGPLADYFALRLARFGRPARSIGSSGLLLADQLLAVRPCDVLLLLSFERLDGDSEMTLARANALGLPVVLLTDTLGPKLADRVDVSLPVLRSRSGAFSGSATTMAILDALLLAVAARDRGRSLAALGELNELRRQLRGAPVQNELR
jgi:DNA-binding MurR/RpiR family transcriptional regulator